MGAECVSVSGTVSWEQLGLGVAATSDSCSDPANAGACCGLKEEVESALAACMLSVPSHSDGLVMVMGMCEAPQCIAALDLMAALGARQGALCSKLGPTFTHVAQMGRALCANSGDKPAVAEELDVDTSYPCVMEMVEGAQKVGAALLSTQLGTAEEPPEPTSAPVTTSAPLPPAAAPAPSPPPPAIPNAPTEASHIAGFFSHVRSHLGHKDQKHKHKRKHHGLLNLLQTATRGTHVGRILTTVSNFFMNAEHGATGPLEPPAERLADIKEAMNKFCTPCATHVLASATALAKSLDDLLRTLDLYKMAELAQMPPPEGDMHLQLGRGLLIATEGLPAVCARGSEKEICVAEPLSTVKMAGLEPEPQSVVSMNKELLEPAAVCGDCGMPRAKLTVIADAMLAQDAQPQLPIGDSHPLEALVGFGMSHWAAWHLDHACHPTPAGEPGPGKKQEAGLCFLPAMAVARFILNTEGVEWGEGNPLQNAHEALTAEEKASFDFHTTFRLSTSNTYDDLSAVATACLNSALSPTRTCSPACYVFLNPLPTRYGCCGATLAAMLLAYTAPRDLWASVEPNAAFISERSVQKAEELVMDLAAVCSVPALVEPCQSMCWQSVEFVIPLAEESVDLNEGHIGALSRAIVDDLAAATGEAANAFLVDGLATSPDGLHATAHVQINPCDRARIVAEQLSALVDKSELFFPQVNAVLVAFASPAEETSPFASAEAEQKHAAEPSFVRGMLVFGKRPAGDAAQQRKTIAMAVAHSIIVPEISPTDVQVTIDEAALLMLQQRKKASRLEGFEAKFVVMKPLTPADAAGVVSGLAQAIAQPGSHLATLGVLPHASEVTHAPEHEKPAPTEAPAKPPKERAEVKPLEQMPKRASSASCAVLLGLLLFRW
jgi:hypothetical protein